MTQLQDHGVLEGCAVSAQGSPDTTVAVAAGSVLNANVAASVAAVSSFDILTGHPADATLDRIDIISVDNTGTVNLTVGTPAVVPQQPDTSDVLIASVYVYSQANASYTGTIVAGVVQDLRRFALIHTSPYRVSGLWYGPTANNAGKAATWTNNTMYLLPYFVGKAFSIQAIGIAIGTPAATAGSKVRLGIYSDDGAGGLSLLVDAGQVAADGGTSTPSAATSQTLTPGWWWFAVAFQSLGATKPMMEACVIGATGGSPVGAASLTQAAGFPYGAQYFTGISGALPTTPTSPDYSQQTLPGVWVQAT